MSIRNARGAAASTCRYGSCWEWPTRRKLTHRRLPAGSMPAGPLAIFVALPEGVAHVALGPVFFEQVGAELPQTGRVDFAAQHVQVGSADDAIRALAAEFTALPDVVAHHRFRPALVDDEAAVTTESV